MKQLLAVLLCISFPLSLTAQSNTNAPTGATASAGSLSVDDVIKLSKAGVDDDVIIQKIKKQGQPFDLTTDQLIQLKSASVSNRVIQIMIDPTKASPSGTTSSASMQSTGMTSSSPGDATPAKSFVESSAPQTDNRPRIYLVSASKGSQWNAARDQSMEMSKDFEKNCLGVRITINQSAADYSVVLNHIEHGFARDNQIQIANKDGDLISKTKEGGSINGDVKKACEIILADWAKSAK